MKITVLGSGSFFIDKEHSAPAYLFQTSKKNILVDCGPGTQNQLAKIDFDPLELDYIFITHFHNDHTSDLLSVLVRAYLHVFFYGGIIDHDITIVGPKGVREFCIKLGEIYNHDGFIKLDNLKFIEFEESNLFDDFQVKTYQVVHLGLDAYALRFIMEDKEITYTGDASLTENVAIAARNVDLFIADTAVKKGGATAAHMSTTQVGEICRDNNVKKVVLSHQVPPVYNIDVVSEVREVFDGEVVLAKDLMEIIL